MNAALIQAERASFAYDREPVLHDISLAIEAGEFVGIIGPNGSGKSTLLKLMSGHLNATGGRLSFQGQPMTGLAKKTLACNVAWVPQEHAMAFPFRVMEIVLMGRHPYVSPLRFETAEDHRVAEKALDLTGTRALAERRYDEISGGEKQRVMIAAAIAQDTPALILDEPTAALDLKFQVEIMSILKRLNRDENRTLVVALHDLHLASRYCHRLVLLDGGRIVRDGPTAQVLTREVLEPVYGISLTLLDDGRGGVHVSPEAACK